MRLTIFGGTGMVGGHLVRRALAAGHEVTAVVRDPARLAEPRRDALHVVTADPMDPVAIAPAVTGADGVLTTLGPRGSGPTRVIRDSAASIVAAMTGTHTRRLVLLTGSVASTAGDGPGMRLSKSVVTRLFLKHGKEDMLAGEEHLHASALDWTVIRPPRLTDKPATGRYRTALEVNVPRGMTVSRDDVAAEMLRLVTDRATVHHHVFMAN